MSCQKRNRSEGYGTAELVVHNNAHKNMLASGLSVNKDLEKPSGGFRRFTVC
jgi:hypothetical protein